MVLEMKLSQGGEVVFQTRGPKGIVMWRFGKFLENNGDVLEKLRRDFLKSIIEDEIEITDANKINYIRMKAVGKHVKYLGKFWRLEWINEMGKYPQMRFKGYSAFGLRLRLVRAIHCFGHAYKYEDCKAACPYFDDCYNVSAKKVEVAAV